MRRSFTQEIVQTLRTDLEKEVGPFPLRKSSQLYEAWVQQAGPPTYIMCATEGPPQGPTSM